MRAADEVETARRYLHIQELRHAPRLSVHITSEPLAADELVPPLVLLPLVENAVLHGLAPSGETHVSLTLSLGPDHVVFAVADDGPGLGASVHVEGTGIGIGDLRARLATLYGDTASLTTAPAREDALRPGLRVELRIPREGT